MDEIRFIEQEAARLDVYKSLSECFYSPGSNLALILERLAKALPVIKSDSREHVPALREAVKEKNGLPLLRIDFARLFVGPYGLKAPPYGSVYLDGKPMMMGHSTVHALEHYRDAGLTPEKGFRDAPDHVAVELEFMYYLIFKEIEAIQAGNAALAEESNDRQHDFLHEHLGAWVFPFTELVESRAENQFYRNLASILAVFISEELSAITRIGAKAASA